MPPITHRHTHKHTHTHTHTHTHQHTLYLKQKNCMAPFYGWGSTTLRLEPLRAGSLLFTTFLSPHQFPVLTLSTSEG